MLDPKYMTVLRSMLSAVTMVRAEPVPGLAGWRKPAR